MHDIQSPYNIIDPTIATSPEVMGRECLTCRRLLAYDLYRRDTSYRDGRRDQCIKCESEPELSMAEQTARLREMNNSSAAVQAQRWEKQEEYRNERDRWGRVMASSDFLRVLKRLVPSLYMMDGRVENDVAVFEVSDRPRDDWGGKAFRYLWYVPGGMLPEFSLYEFDEVRDIPIREKQRGWRTPLLMLIESGLLTESDCKAVFGEPSPGGRSVWERKMYAFRNRSMAAQS